MDCCREPRGYEDVFSRRFSKSLARRYQRRGLTAVGRRMVRFVTAHGIDEATVLEIGGGVGDIEVDLLRHGARSATNLELSSNYDEDARALMDRYGLSARMTRRAIDIALAPDTVEPADVVVLNRVVCCYPDHARLLSAAGAHAKSVLVFSHPTIHVLWRLSAWWDNVWYRFRSSDFRAYVHDPAAMVAAVEGAGLRQVMRHRGPSWTVLGFERLAPLE